MGNACCVAPRYTITNGTSSDILQRNRWSPSWSFRWENRQKVAGEDMSSNWFADEVSGDSRLDLKPVTIVETGCASEVGSTLDSPRASAWQKPLFPNRATANLGFPMPDTPIAGNSREVKESTESPAVSYQSDLKYPSSVPPVSSYSISSLSSQNHLLPSSSTGLIPTRQSPPNQLSRLNFGSEFKSPALPISEEASRFVFPGSGNESLGGSNGGSSNMSSTAAYPDPMVPPRKERWLFDSETWGFGCDKTSKSSEQNLSSPCLDIQTCGICEKLLTERTSLRILSNEVPVVAVLSCGHVYHAECLDNITAEINKYDPICPVCTFGEKQAPGKALTTDQREPKAKKGSKKRVIDGDLVFDHQRNSGYGGSPKMSLSSSTKNSSVRPFLRRHFSFGSNRSRSLSESLPIHKRRFFWAKSRKEQLD